MNILFSLHMYPPHHLAGGEMYAHNMAKILISHGFKVRVYLHYYWGTKTDQMYNYEGVDVFPPSSHAIQEECFRWADIVVTHLDFTKWSIWKAKSLNKPCVFIVHNTSHFYDDMINSNDNTFVIYNAYHAKEELQYKRPSMVLEPMLGDCVAEDREPEYITLVNLCRNKGVRQFYKIAERMPEKRFLGITGSYMDQHTNCPPNVTIWPKTPIKEVMRVTRLLLMPSDYESWGMVAAEAQANGIPVICSPTPGLVENCGTGAQYLSWRNVTKWVSLIRKLDNPKVYKRWSEAAIRRTSERVDRTNELIQFLYKAYEYKLQR